MDKGAGAKTAVLKVNIDEDLVAARNIRATIDIFGENIDDEPEDKEAEERRKKIAEYLDTLPPKKR